MPVNGIGGLLPKEDPPGATVSLEVMEARFEACAPSSEIY
jgi:hypothetical protein